MTDLSGVSTSDVRDIYDTSEDDASIQFAVDAAEILMTEAGVDDSDFEGGQNSVDVVGTYLAIHVLAASDPTVEESDKGDSSHTYESMVGEGLRETRYGRRALLLDPTGELDSIDDPEQIFESYGVN